MDTNEANKPVHPGAKLKLARLSQRPFVSQKGVAIYLGKPRSNIAHIEAETINPRKEDIARVALWWGIPEAWFWNGRDEPVPPSIYAEETRAAVSSNTLVPEAGQELPIPFWGNVPCGPTEGQNPREEILETIEVPGFLAGAGRIGARVVLDSMAPRLIEGDILIFHNDPAPRVGRIVLVTSPDGAGTIKALRRKEGGGWELRPLNATAGGVDEGVSWQIIGYLIAVLRDYAKGRGSMEWDTGGISP